MLTEIPRMKCRWSASALAIIVIAAGGCGHEPDGSPELSPGRAGCSDSQVPVRIIVPADGRSQTEWRMAIPANYLGNSETWAGGIQHRIRINASFPSLSARPTGTFWSSCGGDTNRQSNSPDPSAWPSDRLEIQIGAGVYRFQADQDDYTATPSDVSGLSQVQNKCMIEAASAPSSPNCAHVWGYFPTAPTEGGTVSIACRGNTSNPSASCEGIFPFHGQDVEYAFARSELGHWQQYEKAARILLTRFSN